MSYSSELDELKKQQLYQRVFSSDVIDSLPFITDAARSENERNRQTLLNYYDYKIAKLEPLAQQEQREQILNAAATQDIYISGTLEKDLEKAMQSLFFH